MSVHRAIKNLNLPSKCCVPLAAYIDDMVHNGRNFIIKWSFNGFVQDCGISSGDSTVLHEAIEMHLFINMLDGRHQGGIWSWKHCLISIGIPIIKIRWSHNHLIFMWIPVPGKTVFILKQAPGVVT